MAKYIQMIAVLIGISLVSGLSLGGLNSLTEERAKSNVLRFKKVPAVVTLNKIVSGEMDTEAESKLIEELLAERKELELEPGADPLVLFVLKKDGAPYAVAFDQSTKGYAGGEVAVMVGFNLSDNKLIGIEPAVVDQTPGVGDRIKDGSFTMQFRGAGLDTVFKVRKDGGAIDGISGATVSCQAAVENVSRAVGLFRANEAKIRELVKE